ncbi:efflux RND transporter periplasmic adaptor subunit [Halomonas sp. LY9]
MARQSVALAFEPAGRVQSVLAERGDAVEQGDVLASLDTRRLESRLAEVEARREEARASLALAQRQEEREAQLNQSNFASRTALDQARTDRLTLQARLSALAAERDSLTADLEDSTLKAPFAGRVVERHIDVGSLVSSGTAAFDLVDTRQLEAHLGLPARLVATFGVGESVTLQVNGQTIEGKYVPGCRKWMTTAARKPWWSRCAATIVRCRAT